MITHRPSSVPALCGWVMSNTSPDTGLLMVAELKPKSGPFAAPGTAPEHQNVTQPVETLRRTSLKQRFDFQYLLQGVRKDRVNTDKHG